MDTIPLSAARVHIGQSVSFIAAVQQVLMGKRVLAARERVESCHVLLVGDSSRQFFRITCWGEAPPTLTIKDSTRSACFIRLSHYDAALQVGDIVLFSSCRIKSYRGDVEAQFVHNNDETVTSSTVQLLFRKDRYFDTQEVSLKSLYPTIEWYKQHCRDVVIEDENMASTASKRRKNRSLITDLRENMMVSILCKLRSATDTEYANARGVTKVASETDGVLLRELVMFDSAGDEMNVNLWDQHADKRFVTRLLEHRGAIEISNVVVSLQALSNQLLANTTPHTTFRLLDPGDPESIATTRELACLQNVDTSALSEARVDPLSFASVKDLESSVFEALAILTTICVEQICLNRPFGTERAVLARFASHLAEQFCTGCDQTLPELPCRDYAAQLQYGACPNKCETYPGSTIRTQRDWRYRCFTMILCDSWNDRLQVEADDRVFAEILGNIEARALTEGPPSRHQFNTSWAAASLINALVGDADQKFDATLVCSTDKVSQNTGSYQESSHAEDRLIARKFILVSLVPCDVFSV
uniref:Cell division control protein 24 OB domain-containing protein n=1 Tax=Peronospora matthiolae TaxID=2874970 RepID=A0AAV1VLC3_9STRA